MNTLNMPGFTAENSIYKYRSYRLMAGANGSDPSSVIPPTLVQDGGIRPAAGPSLPPPGGSGGMGGFAWCLDSDGQPALCPKGGGGNGGGGGDGSSTCQAICYAAGATCVGICQTAPWPWNLVCSAGCAITQGVCVSQC